MWCINTVLYLVYSQQVDLHCSITYAIKIGVLANMPFSSFPKVFRKIVKLHLFIVFVLFFFLKKQHF